MCLYVKGADTSTVDSIKNVAKKAIKCYKVVACNEAFGKFYAPMQHVAIEKSVIDGAVPFEPEIPFDNDLVYSFVYHKERWFEITSGVIHACREFENAKREADWLSTHSVGDYSSIHIFECEIPEGATYFDGIWGGERHSYASDKVVFKREIYYTYVQKIEL